MLDDFLKRFVCPSIGVFLSVPFIQGGGQKIVGPHYSSRDTITEIHNDVFFVQYKDTKQFENETTMI